MTHNAKKRTLLSVFALLMAGTLAFSGWKLNVLWREESLRKPLIDAIKDHDLDKVNTLLEEGASADSLDSTAPAKGFRAIFEEMFLNHNTEIADSALYLASENLDDDICNALIQHGADVNHQNKHGMTALMSSSNHSDLTLAIALLNHGAKVMLRNEWGFTALHFSKMQALCAELLRRGANVNARDDSGYTPLQVSCISGSDECCNYLIEAGSDINSVDNKGVSVLENAVNSNLFAARLLIEKGAKVKYEYRNPEGYTLMHLAVHAAVQNDGNEKIIKLLLMHGVKPDEVDKEGVTPLMIACSNGVTPTSEGNLSILNILLAAGADPNHKDNKGETAIERLEATANATHQANVIEKKILLLPKKAQRKRNCVRE